MPKSKTRKNRTPGHRIKAAQRRQSYAIQKQIKNFWCADGTMLPNMVTKSLDKAVVLPSKTIDKIIADEYNWQIMCFVFCAAEGRLYYKADAMEEVGTIRDLTPAIRKMLTALIDGQNHKHFVSYGWWASPAGDLDLEQMEEELVELFKGHGAFDADMVNVNMVTRYG